MYIQYVYTITNKVKNSKLNKHETE